LEGEGVSTKEGSLGVTEKKKIRYCKRRENHFSGVSSPWGRTKGLFENETGRTREPKNSIRKRNQEGLSWQVIMGNILLIK